MNVAIPETTAPPVFAPSPPVVLVTEPEAPVASLARADEPADDRSEAVASLLLEPGARATVIRAGAGLVATLPFALVAGLGSHAGLVERIGSALVIPTSLALIALVSLASATIGMSLVSAPVTPHQAAEVGAHGALRTGLVLLGLTPITWVWSLSHSGIESVAVGTLGWGIAGLVGAITIALRLAQAARGTNGHLALGAVPVLGTLWLFILVLGVRVWLTFVVTHFPGLEP